MSRLIDADKLIEFLDDIPPDAVISKDNIIQFIKDEPTINEWIPVRERLPKVKELVVIKCYFTNYKGEKIPKTRLCTMSKRKNFYDHIYD